MLLNIKLFYPFKFSLNEHTENVHLFTQSIISGTASDIPTTLWGKETKKQKKQNN